MAYWNNKLDKDSITYVSYKFKKGWFELTANFCPRIGQKVQRLGRSVFTKENMEIVEDILKNVTEHETEPDKLETIKYIWWGIRRLTGVMK